MKLIDRLIFLTIAIALIFLCVKSLQVIPVEAAKEQILKIDIVRIGNSTGAVWDLKQVLTRIRKDMR